MSSVSGKDVPLIPKKVIFGDPEKDSPSLSPDGSRLAYLAPVEGVLNVWVGDIGGDYQPITNDRKRGIMEYFWSVDGQRIMYLQDEGGNERWHLYSVDLPTNETKDLTPFGDVRVGSIFTSRKFPGDLMVSMNKEQRELFDMYRLDIGTGELNMAAKNPGNVEQWLVDDDFKVRGAMTVKEGGRMGLVLRQTEEDEWEDVITWEFEDSINGYSHPLGFSNDGRILYLVDSRDSNTKRLVSLGVEGKELEVIAEDPEYDVSQALFHPDTQKVQAVGFMKERHVWKPMDDAVEEDFALLAELGEGDFFVTDRDENDRKWLVAYTKDTGPTSYHLFDRETKESTPLFETKPELNDYVLAEMEPIRFTARDGLEIQGYLTCPPGKERKDLPLVLYVHGGPHSRDEWGLGPRAQWLANRGYAVLQVNYRGSQGYGKKFLHAGDKEWGGKMLDDLVDAVDWAVEEGIADPEKVAIFGGSYGGYAALCGAAFTDKFKCAVDVYGPSNLLTSLKDPPPEWALGLEDVYRWIGDPNTEEELLKSRSPFFHADRIKIPMLIGQGANDQRVKKAESDQIVEALKANGVEHEYVVFEDEGHGFVKPENRMKFYSIAEKFLARHLGGRCEE